MAKTAKQLNKTAQSIYNAFDNTEARLLPFVLDCVEHWIDYGNWTPLANFIAKCEAMSATHGKHVKAVVRRAVKARYSSGRFETANKGAVFHVKAIKALRRYASFGGTARTLCALDAARRAASKVDGTVSSDGTTVVSFEAKQQDARKKAETALRLAMRKAIEAGMTQGEIDKMQASVRADMPKAPQIAAAM